MAQPSEMDPAEFIAMVQERTQEAHRLDALFRRVTGVEPRMWGSSIIGYGAYRMTYASGREALDANRFQPAQGIRSISGGYCDQETGARHAAALDRLGKHARGKSCLYVNKLADLDLAVLEEMIRADWEAMNRRYPA